MYIRILIGAIYTERYINKLVYKNNKYGGLKMDKTKIKKNANIWVGIFIAVILISFVAMYFNFITSGGFTFILLVMMILIFREKLSQRISLLELK